MDSIEECNTTLYKYYIMISEFAASQWKREEFCLLSLVARAPERSQRVELTVSLLFYLLPNQ